MYLFTAHPRSPFLPHSSLVLLLNAHTNTHTLWNTPITRSPHTSPLRPHRASLDHSSPEGRWQWRMGRPATGTLPAWDSYGRSSRLTAGATCQVVERLWPLITSVTWSPQHGGLLWWWKRSLVLGGMGRGGTWWSSMSSVQAGLGDVTVRARETVMVAWSLIKCTGMMGNEYIARKLEGVGRRWTALCVCEWSDDPSVAQGDPGERSS